MTTFQALMLGMMMAWTPSLVALAYLLVRAPEIESDDEWLVGAEAQAELIGGAALAGGVARGLEMAKALRQGPQFDLTGG
jgi:hypothetical protein